MLFGVRFSLSMKTQCVYSTFHIRHGFLFISLFHNKHCFICRPSHSRMSEAEAIKPKVLQLWHWLSGALTTRLDLIHSRQLIHTRLDLLHTRLDRIHSRLAPQHSARSHNTRLDLTALVYISSTLGYISSHSFRSYCIFSRLAHPHSARSHPHSARSHPHSARSHPPSARSHPLLG
jgi:hypothetical protein